MSSSASSSTVSVPFKARTVSAVIKAIIARARFSSLFPRHRGLSGDHNIRIYLYRPGRGGKHGTGASKSPVRNLLTYMTFITQGTTLHEQLTCRVTTICSGVTCGSILHESAAPGALDTQYVYLYLRTIDLITIVISYWSVRAPVGSLAALHLEARLSLCWVLCGPGLSDEVISVPCDQFSPEPESHALCHGQCFQRKKKEIQRVPVKWR